MNKKTSTEYSRDARKRNWNNIFEMFGGRRCMICHQASEMPIFELHHHNQDGKESDISRIIHHSWEKVEKEVRKCILVCSNCHRTIHHIERQRKR